MSAPYAQRLRKELRDLKKNPVQNITASPKENNILEWHYVIEGPKNSPFEGGWYHGVVIFPKEYPFKPPSIQMTTPNGRFKVAAFVTTFISLWQTSFSCFNESPCHLRHHHVTKILVIELFLECYRSKSDTDCHISLYKTLTSVTTYYFSDFNSSVLVDVWFPSGILESLGNILVSSSNQTWWLFREFGWFGC